MPARPAGLPAAPSPVGTSGQRIVVTDDDPDVISAMHALFASLGAEA
jgi:hypothetical protein